jgi:hypothetical protein
MEPSRCPRCASPSLQEFRTGRVFVSGCSGCGGFYVGGADLRWLTAPDPDDASAAGPGRVEARIVGLIFEFLLDMCDGAS